jgi:hypothetical protein
MNRFALIVIVIMVLLAALMIYAAMLPSQTQPSVVEWMEDTYSPVVGCPGDEVAYTLRLRVSKPAVLFVAVAQLRGGEEGDTIQGNQMGQLFTTIIPSARTITDNDAVWTIPDLPPGDYVRVVAAGTLTEPSQPAIRLQPYTIVEGCQ